MPHGEKYAEKDSLKTSFSIFFFFFVFQVVCVGSIAELKQLSGVVVKDLHRET